MKAGADIEAANDQGSTPLYISATRGHREIMEALIEAGANVDCRRVAGTTPLFSAAERGYIDIVRLLLRAKASSLLTRTDPSGETWIPLDAAVATGHPEVACELIQQRGIDGCGGPSRGVNALSLAAQFQSIHILAKLLDAGVVDTGDALLFATELGREAPMKILLQRAPGGRAYATKAGDAMGVTPCARCCWLLCCWLRDRAVAQGHKLLVDAGANASSAVQVASERGVVIGRDLPLGCTLVCLG